MLPFTLINWLKNFIPPSQLIPSKKPKTKRAALISSSFNWFVSICAGVSVCSTLIAEGSFNVFHYLSFIVSGKLYAFNKTTGERMWIQDMRDSRNGPQSYYANRNTQSRFSDSQHRVQDLPPPRASIETVHGRDNRANRLQLPGTPE